MPDREDDCAASSPVRPVIEDPVLMSRIRAGDKAAYAVFFERHAGAARAVAMRTLHDPVLAHEVTQDAFLAVWNQRATFAPDRGSARGWLLAMVQYRAIDVVRRETRRRHKEAAGDAALQRDADHSVEQQVIIRDEARAIRGLLEAIPLAQRRVITLAYVDGLSQSEIACRLQLPLGTVKGQARLGLEKLRAAYPPPG